MTTISLFTAAGFPLLSLIFFTILFKEMAKAISRTTWPPEKKNRIRNRFLIALLGWALIISIASLAGFTGKFDLFPVNVAPFILLPLVTITWAVASKNMQDVLVHVPPAFLTNLQVFRVFVEILLWAFFVQGIVPEQMTFEGRNLDILSGIFGGLVGLFFIKNKKIVWLYNLGGLLLLINIVTVAVLSMPTPFRVFMEEPVNTIVVTWPTIFLPTFLVPLAYGLHFLSIRELLQRP
jgi:hypothetical protein